MKTTIVFNEDEQHLAALAVRLPDLLMDLESFRQAFRSEYKYNDHITAATLEMLHETFYELLGDYLG